MTREDFKKIIALRSIWTVGKGDYELPDGKYLRIYIRELVESQLKIDKLVVTEKGDLQKAHCEGELICIYHMGYMERTYVLEQLDRINALITDIIYETQPVKGKELDVI